MNTMPFATTGPPGGGRATARGNAVDGGEFLRAVELPEQLTRPRRGGANHAVARARQQHSRNERDGADDAALVLAPLRWDERRVPDLLAAPSVETSKNQRDEIVNCIDNRL